MKISILLIELFSTINAEAVETCQYHSAVFPEVNSDYFVLICLGPGVPTVSLYKIHPQKGPQFVTMLQNNTALRVYPIFKQYLKRIIIVWNKKCCCCCCCQERLATVALPEIKSFPVQMSGGYNAHVRLHLPPGLREDEITRYPMVVQV